MSYSGKRVQDKVVGGTIRKQIEEDNGDGEMCEAGRYGEIGGEGILG